MSHFLGGVAEAAEGVADVGEHRRTCAAIARRCSHRGEVDVGHGETGLEIDEQPRCGLLAHPGDQTKGVGVVGGHRAPELERRMHRDDRQRKRWPDAVRAEEGFEARPLVAAREAEQRLCVLAHVMVDVEEDLTADISEEGDGRRRDRDAVPDTGHLDEDFAVRRTFEERAPQRADHVRSSRARQGAQARWHSASAAASAASGGLGGAARARRACTSFCTCAFVAAP